MAEYPFTLDQIVGWFSGKQAALRECGVVIAEIRKRSEHLPAAAADFDGSQTIGRISAWVSGEFDFETIRVCDGENVFWCHVDASSLDDLEASKVPTEIFS